jgi:O-methyltransferase
MRLDAQVAKISVNDEERLRYLVAEAAYQAALDEGDFIEMGVYRGGSAVWLAAAIKQASPGRRLHLLDSWEGLPPLHDHDAGTFVREGIFDDATEEGVRALLEQMKLIDVCEFRKGWFNDTLPGLEGPFALAHCDGDLYDSVKVCLDHLLPRMTAHGSIIVDDYGNDAERRFPGCRRAVLESIAGTPWVVCPLGGARDQSIKLVRTIECATPRVGEPQASRGRRRWFGGS